MKYEEPPRMSRAELEEIFDGRDGQKIGTALISATYTEDGPSILGWCMKFVEHEDGVVRHGVALAIGTVAISQGDLVDLRKCLEVAEKLRSDPNEDVRVAADDALDDVLHSLQQRGGTPS